MQDAQDDALHRLFTELEAAEEIAEQSAQNLESPRPLAKAKGHAELLASSRESSGTTLLSVAKSRHAVEY